MTHQDKRSYDIAFPHQVRMAILERREHPTGEVHEVKTEERGGDIVQIYPWDKMLLGDFFLAKIGIRSIKAMRQTFLKAARRYDFEIAVKQVEDFDGEDALRVTVTMLDISIYRKRAARDHGINMVIHDVKHAKAKRRNRDKYEPRRSPLKRAKGEPAVYPTPEPEVERAKAINAFASLSMTDEEQIAAIKAMRGAK